MVESRISSLESVAEQTNIMMQNMMKMFEKFTKTEEKRAETRQQTNEVVTMMDQYNAKTSRGEEQE
jgi:polyhydroxyalkanoate synthesis regulator protein